MMEVIEFRRSPEAEPELFGCGHCRRVYSDRMFCGGKGAGRDAAERCCIFECESCGASVSRGRARCELCHQRQVAEAREEAFARARKIGASECNNPVWDEHLDEYYGSVSEWLEAYDEDEDPKWLGEPSWAWVAHVVKPQVHAEDVVDAILCDAPEDLHDRADLKTWKDVEELEEFLQAWMSKQDISWYEASRMVAVVAPGKEDEDSDEG